MRPRLSVPLLVAFLLLVGVCPPIASVIGSTLGLMFAGIGELLAQPSVLLTVLGVLVVTAYRGRPRTRTA
ncbi:hypothetical protein [Streptomyces sp. NPDC055243]|uniref:hypothetical protein n=1 Tax=Streptomyces sp. NPDC055243 TaxID=3365720 RepID=UPI0037D7FAB5